jgi:membrane-bound serine protease (ClpP class)
MHGSAACRSIFALTLALTMGRLAAQPARTVIRAEIDNQIISPVTARFVEQAIGRAESAKAEALILVLDTPGGLVESTRQITKRILSSDVPVVVYVGPAGARAASAGLFLTMAAHVAAMAPGTNIGAAHPVSVGGLPLPSSDQPGPGDDSKGKGKKEPAGGASSPGEQKAVNDTVAWVRSLAELRGRNADWVEQAVRESVSVSSQEALQLKVVDLIANDFAQLVEALNGRTVRVKDQDVTLQTAGAQVENVSLWWGERVLAAIAHPNVAFLLLMFGFYGVLLELYTPGWGVSGTIGIVCLALAFFGLAILPINYTGLALILIGLGLLVAEAFVTSFGFLTIGGMLCLVFGGLMLVDSPGGFVRVSGWVVIPVALATAAITVFLVTSILRSSRGRSYSGGEALLQKQAIAQTAFAAERGMHRGQVMTHGELWQAVSVEPVAAGQAVVVEKRDGLTLYVRPGVTNETTSEGSTNT